MFLAQNRTLGEAFKLMGQSHSKDDQNCSKIVPPGARFGAPWTSYGSVWGLLDQHEGSSCDILAQLRGHGSDF